MFSLARVAVAQSSSLSLFTNRDAELEQRAMLLKRLAFTIYSSEVDQYQKYLPDIQGNNYTYIHIYYWGNETLPMSHFIRVLY